MRILFIVPYTPSLIRVRPYNLLRNLAERGHALTLMTLVQDATEAEQAEALAKWCLQLIALPISRQRSLWNTLTALPSPIPLQSVYSWQPALADRMETLINGRDGQAHFDMVHVEHLRGARYGIFVKEAFASVGRRLPIVWDSVDCISRLFRQAASNGAGALSRLITRFELPRTERYEGWLLGQFDRVVATSPHDAAALRRLNPEARDVAIVPNGVDLTYFTPKDGGTRNPSRIVMTGKMSYHANVSMAIHFARHILPSIWVTRKDAQLWIVGKDPPREVRNLGDHPQIKVTGTVPDIRPYLQSASVAVAPAPYSAGIQNKVLEAMACGTPVVASPQAVAALGAQHCRDLFVAGDPAAFASRVVSLMDDPGVRTAIGRAGRRYVEEHHQWTDSARKLEDIYRELISA